MTELQHVVWWFAAVWALSWICQGTMHFLGRRSQSASQALEWRWRFALFAPLLIATLALIWPNAWRPYAIESPSFDASLDTGTTSVPFATTPPRAANAPMHEAMPVPDVAPMPAIESESAVEAAQLDAARRAQIAAARTAALLPGAVPRSLPERATAARDETTNREDSSAFIISMLAAGSLAWLLLQVIRLLRQAWHLNQLTRRLPDPDHPELERELSALARRMNVREPELRADPHWLSPALVPIRLLRLPIWVLALRDAGTRQAVLAHELAHLSRRDPFWRLATLLVTRVWWTPWSRHVYQELEALAERHADALAAQCLGNSRALAHALLACAEHVEQQHEPSLALTMLSHEGSLLKRVQSLLQGSTIMNKERPNTRWHQVAALGLALGAAILMPTLSHSEAQADTNGTAPVAEPTPVSAPAPIPAPRPTSGTPKAAPAPAPVPVATPTPRAALAPAPAPTSPPARTNRLMPVPPAPPAPPAPPSPPSPPSELAPLAPLSPLAPPALPSLPSLPTPPSPPAPPAAPVAGKYSSVRISDADVLWFGSSQSIELSNDDESLSLEGKGEYEFNDAESDVVTMSKGARLRVTHERDGVEREVEFRENGGKIQRRFWIDGTEQTFDARATTWLAETLPSVVKESGFNAGPRTKRWLKQGGVANAVQQIRGISSDYGRREHLIALAENASLSGATLNQVLDVTAGTESDFEFRSSIEALIEHSQFGDNELAHMLTLTAKRDSDFEKRTLLENATERFGAKVAGSPAWFAVIESMQSDFERRVALEGLLEQAPKDGTQILRLLNATSLIESDFEARSLLQQVAPLLPATAAVSDAYGKAISRLDSDFERREALMSLIDQGSMDALRAKTVLNAVSAMSSDFERREVLTELAEVMPSDPETRTAFLAVTAQMSAYERQEAESALARLN